MVSGFHGKYVFHLIEKTHGVAETAIGDCPVQKSCLKDCVLRWFTYWFIFIGSYLLVHMNGPRSPNPRAGILKYAADALVSLYTPH